MFAEKVSKMYWLITGNLCLTNGARKKIRELHFPFLVKFAVALTSIFLWNKWNTLYCSDFVVVFGENNFSVIMSCKHFHCFAWVSQSNFLFRSQKIKFLKYSWSQATKVCFEIYNHISVILWICDLDNKVFKSQVKAINLLDLLRNF